ncbi:MAG: valine--tRNA ligase [Bacteroidota bacterium]
MSESSTAQSTRYNPTELENKWYQHWMDQQYFASKPDEREAYSIVIPPPNVTGVLHMGHMLNNTIQDILIRKARQEGKNACWVPGTDHASIATEAKVVKRLREQGIKKSDIGRDEFLKHAWAWKEEFGGKILDQLKQLGASCDWDRTSFTMDPGLSKAVMKVFVDLHKKGKIYRGKRMTNWDPEAKTVLSNEEVIYKEENSRLFHVRYRIEGTEDEWITIATTRPETIMGDTAIAINPKDERYTHLQGRKAIVPLIGRVIPIISDGYVEMEFGTGALKVTPAHDMNDHEIGERHQLEIVDVFNDDGTMSEAAQLYIGQDRFAVRKLVAKDLEKAGHIVKIEDYRNTVGRSERTDAVVEPRLTLQWFLDMKDFAKTALDAVSSKEVQFFPEHFWNMYHNWLNEDNIRDWCISRQLWWGHRIPAWYYGEDTFVAETAEEALEMARQKSGIADLPLSELKQDEDVVDTWFSSWLWPISVFNGFESPEELRYYYPTNVLVTAWDIIFFWVARMVMAGYEWSGELLGPETAAKKGIMPFKAVYFTGMVRDEKRRKMSKSLGNSPDAIQLMDRYGADGVRFGMLSSAAAGNDIVFDAPIDPKTKKVLNESKLCEQGQNFCNKMWNALRLIKGLPRKEQAIDKETALINALAIQWFEHKLEQTAIKIQEQFETFRLSEALMNLYTFIWGDFCSWYLEMIKPPYGEAIDEATYQRTLELFEKLMSLLHPFMPFVTEEIWHQLQDRQAGDDCIISPYPRGGSFDAALITKVDTAMEVVAKIRDARNKNGIKQKEPLTLFIQKTSSTSELFELAGLKEMIVKMAYLSELTFTEEEIDNSVSFLAGTGKYFLLINKQIDVAAEIARLEEDLGRQQMFVKKAEKKLGNPRFVDGAPPAVVEKERKKLSDGQARIKAIEEELEKLRNK